MQKVLRKRILRDFKENLFRYLALGGIIILCMYLVISLIGTAETMIQGSEKTGKKNQVEEGQFSVFLPLSEEAVTELEGKGITIEEQFYLDFLMEDESTLRLFKEREEINLYEAVYGRAPENDDEVALERRYCEEHGIELNDTVVIGGKELTVVGIGCSPDYDAPLKNFTDASVDSVQFGTAFVTDSLYEELLAEGKSLKAEEYVYSYLLNGAMSHDELREFLEDITVVAESIDDEFFQEYYNEQIADRKELYGCTDELIEKYFDIEISSLKTLVKAEDNSRIKAAANDQIVNKLAGIMAGIIVIILFAYVISVFVVYGIEKEITTIGALYSLGVKNKELIKHYLFLPVMVTFLASTIGSVLGFNAIGGSTIVGNCYDYFSIPNMGKICPTYLIVYGLVMPPVIAVVVNYFVIKSKLNKPALAMLRNEKKVKKAKYIKLGKLGFVGTFRIRQMMREARTSLTVLGGMFVSLLILMLGLNCYMMCNNISENNKKDTKFEYLYTLKYPEEEIPEGGYEAYSKMVKKENMGYNLDVTILGITEDNPFFDVNLTDSKSEIVISSAMAEKYSLAEGDVFTVEDEEEKMHYAFTVKDIAEYSTSFYVFMDIDVMRDMFGQEDTYYNVVLADHKLDIEPGRLYGVTTKIDIEKSADVFIAQMQGMINMMTIFSVIIFALVMYLMMKVMIDRSAFNISMVKVFGYRTNEIKKLYLNGNFYVIAVGALVCIPLAKKVMDMLYPPMVANVACGMDVKFSLGMYGIIYAGVILVYLVINQLLVGRLNKVNLAEVLKNRE